jgi:hypothetical protein
MLTFASSSLPYVSRIKVFGSVHSTINCINFTLLVILSVQSFSQIKFEIQYISFVLTLLSTNNALQRSTKVIIPFTKQLKFVSRVVGFCQFLTESGQCHPHTVLVHSPLTVYHSNHWHTAWTSVYCNMTLLSSLFYHVDIDDYNVLIISIVQH